MSALMIALGLASAFLPTIRHTPRHSINVPTRVVARARVPLAFVGPEDESADVRATTVPAALYQQTANGLKYKELETGEGDAIAPDAIVSIKITASLVSTGETISRAAITFERGDGAVVDMLDEAIEGMKVGARRRVVVPPSSKYAALGDESVELEIEALAVKTGRDKLLFNAQRGAAAVARLGFFYVLTDQLISLVLPAADAGGAAASAHVDAANAWAAQGLSAVGLM